MTSKWHQNDPKVYQNLSEEMTEIWLKNDPNDPRMTQKWHQNDLKKWLKKLAKSLPKSVLRNDSRMTQKWHKNDTKIKIKY